MNKEIKEIIQDNGELIVYYKDQSFEVFDTLPQNVLDYITNLDFDLDSYKSKYKNAEKNILDMEKQITNLQEELNEYKSKCEEAKDKLYCYGEIFDRKILQEFQKEMLNILDTPNIIYKYSKEDDMDFSVYLDKENQEALEKSVKSLIVDIKGNILDYYKEGK